MEKLNVYCAIIGGGASGLMCACIAKRNNKDKKIVVLERDNRVGKKILVSGNSRCNLTNLDAEFSNYQTSFDGGLNFLLENYPPQKVLDYFKSIGLVCKEDSENRVYPLSRQASAVLSVLRNELKRQGVDELCETEVVDISAKNGGYDIKCRDKIVHAQKVVIATGGKNNYAQKVVGDTYALCKSIGHSIRKLSPSLCPVKVKSDVVKSLKGIRVQGKVTSIIDGEKAKSEYGEIQFGNDCLSGICVFNLSRELNRNSNCEIVLELLPDYSFEEIKAMIKNRKALTGKDNVQELFTGLFHKNIGIAILKDSNVSTAISTDRLTDRDINAIANTISGWNFEVIKSADFSSAQVTCGGVIGDEIDPKTLESKKAKNVYLCGEVIDVDGDCGGFNLQFAFSSGMCVGEQL